MIPAILKENLSTGVLLLNSSLEVVWTNDSVLQILGTTKSQVVGKSISTWVIDQTDNLYQEALDACVNSGHPFTIEIKARTW